LFVTGFVLQPIGCNLQPCFIAYWHPVGFCSRCTHLFSSHLF
jgi:hypothetical protein